jgi:hypothetical protein
MVHHFPLPYLGHRIIKTTIAVFLCLLLHMLLGYDGMVLQSAIAAIVCMQPYIADTKKFALDRVIGTIMGAAWGLGFLFFASHFPHLPEHMLLVYALMSLGVLVTIYSTVVFRLTDTAGLSAIVFMCIVISYPQVEAPLEMAGARILDTIIGIAVAILVNVIKLPRQKQSHILFFVELQDLVPDRNARMASGVMIALNHLYQDQAKICLVSKWAPAVVMSQTEMLEPTVPSIVMDGVALYDFEEKKYLDIIDMDKEDASFLCRTLKEMNLGYNVYAVRDRTTLIYRQGAMNEAEAKEYEIMKRSTLRNYVDGSYTQADKIAFIRTVDTDEKIDGLSARLQQILPEGRYRMQRRIQPGFPGYSGLYLCSGKATVEQMKQRMMSSYLPDPDLKRIDMVSVGKHYDIERDAMHLLHRVRALYEPIGLPFHH